VNNEGPEPFGYKPAGPTYLFPFERPILSIAERGQFLFQGDGMADNPTVEVLRVFVVGASVAQGVGSSSHETTWHVVLEEALSKDLGREVHLIVAAVPAFVSTQERIALDLMVLPRCPDAVIILNGWDDAALPGMLGSRPGDPINQGLLYEHFFPVTFDFGGVLMRHSALYRYFYHRRILDALDRNRRAIVGDENRLDVYRRSTAGLYIDNLREMLAGCERQSVPCAAFLQPARVLIESKTESPEAWTAQETLERTAYEAIRQRLPALQARYRVHDLSQAFGPGTDWFVDQVHFGDEGHAAIAKAMEPVLAEMLRPITRHGGTSACDARPGAAPAVPH
jgi:lysophospholipase L1-like esterase